MGRGSDFAKRAFDLLACMGGLLVISPVFIGVAIAIKLDSKGPVFYSQTRIGRSGKPFNLHKFRSMVVAADKSLRLTTAGDSRITKVGAFIRRTNLDELPQLLNVIKGEMSLVGPRPEVPEFVDMADPRWLTTLSVRPGMTAPVTVEFRREGEILQGYADPVEGYRREVLPAKLDLNMRYVRTRTFWGDIGTIFATFRDIVTRKH